MIGYKVVTASEMAYIEKMSIDEGASSHDYMKRAGEGIALRILSQKKSKRVIFLTGKGNNGRDGYVAASILQKEQENFLKDVAGVSFGGAMKNIMAIACAISDGLGFGENTKAALMTRGLHEIRKLSKAKWAQPETLNGLAGLGDLCATSLSTLSRNYIFGKLLAEGFSPDEAYKKIGMVVEGAYTLSLIHI